MVKTKEEIKIATEAASKIPPNPFHPEIRIEATTVQITQKVTTAMLNQREVRLLKKSDVFVFFIFISPLGALLTPFKNP